MSSAAVLYGKGKEALFSDRRKAAAHRATDVPARMLKRSGAGIRCVPARAGNTKEIKATEGASREWTQLDPMESYHTDFAGKRGFRREKCLAARPIVCYSEDKSGAGNGGNGRAPGEGRPRRRWRLPADGPVRKRKRE